MSKTSSAIIFLALLVAATLAIYLPGLDNGLVFDDNRLVDGTIFGRFGSLLELRPRMLSYGSFVWVKALLGEDWWKQRLINVLLHLGVAYGLYVLFAQLLECGRFHEEDETDPELAPSKRAALRVGVFLFALNPVAVYAVAYLVQRSIVMASLFVVLACIAWLRALITGRRYWIVLALVSYLLAVMSKETAIMAAALVVPLYIFVSRPTLKRTVAVVIASLLAVAVVAAVLRSLYGSIVGTAFDESSRLFIQQLESLSPGVSQRLFPLSILNQAALFFVYGFFWLVPCVQWMSIDMRPAFPLSLSSFPQVVGAVGFIMMVAGSSWLLLRRSNLLAFLGLCLLIPCILYFSEFAIVWVQDPFVLYRSYLWALAVPGLVAIPLIGLKPKVIYPIGVLLAVLFAGLAVERNLSLKDDFTVWSDAVSKVDIRASPNAVGRWRAYQNRGAYYQDRELPDYAYADFANAVALGEPYGSAFFNMGVSLQLMKRHAEAIALFTKAESMGFVEPALYYHRGESLQALARFTEAYDSYSIALAKRHDPELGKHIRFRRAEVAVVAKKYDSAVSDFTLLLKAAPGDERLMMGLGMAYVAKEDAHAAMAVFNSLLAHRATAAAYYGRALAHVVGAEKALGLKELDQAIGMDPKNAMYRTMRARIADQR